MLTTLDYMKIFHETKNSVTLINSSLQLIEKKHPDVAAYPLWKDTMQEVTYLKKPDRRAFFEPHRLSVKPLTGRSR